MNFNYKKWKSELRETVDAYISLHDPIICDDAMKRYYANSKFIECLVLGTSVMEKADNGKDLTETELIEVKEKYTTEFSEYAHNGILIYRRQMIIIAATIFEAMLNEFLKYYFTKFPEKMYNYVGDRGFIKFKDLIKFPSKEALLMYYADISAKNFTAKPWEVALNRLEELLKTKISDKSKVLDMLSLRNKIIHEGTKMEVRNDDVFDFIEAVENILMTLSTSNAIDKEK